MDEAPPTEPALARPSNPRPLDGAPRDPGPSTERTLARATWAFVVLGVTLRVVRFLLNHPIWGDEAFLATNFLDRGYRDLLRPLDYHQVSPLLFLWVELTAVRLLGFREWSLRLFPTLCAVASVFLFRHAAGRVLRGLPLLLAVAIFAVSFYPIRHGGEIKPYASDLFVSLALLALALEWWREPGQSRWPWALAAFVPVAVGLSHPAIFVAGGVALAMAPTAWKGRRLETLLPFAAYTVAMVATFLGLLVAFTSAQARDVMGTGGMRSYWAQSFPPRGGPGAVVRWLAEIHSGHMFAYPAGGARGLSGLTVACLVAAVVVLWRRKQGTVLTLLLAPFGLGLVAAVLGRYPYGGSARIMQYAAPATCLLAGLGAASLLALPRSPSRRTRLATASLVGLAGLGVALLVIDIVAPFRSPCDQRTREFARWLWAEKGRDAEMACLKVDFGLTFEPLDWEFGRTAVYLCNQRIYSTRHRRRAKLPLDRVSADRPLACVYYNEPHRGRSLPQGHPAFVSWMAGMRARYDLRAHTTFKVNSGTGRFGGMEDHYEVFEFVPRTAPSLATAPGAAPRR